MRIIRERSLTLVLIMSAKDSDLNNYLVTKKGVIIQHKSQKHRSANIKYIYEKINSIIANNTSEKLLVFTDDKELIPVLIEINKLLDYNQKTLAYYSKAETAMRKMLSNISHDLKTPLTVILGYIETINLDSNISSEEKEALLSKVESKTKEVRTSFTFKLKRITY